MTNGKLSWMTGAAGRKVAVIALGTVAAVAVATGAQAQDAAYIRVIGPKGAVAGTAKDAAHQGWIMVSSAENVPSPADVSREASAPSVSEVTVTKLSGKAEPVPSSSNTNVQAPRDVATGLATGKRQHQPITIRKEVDASSPLLKEMMTTGAHLPEVDVMMSAKAGQPAMSYKLTDVMVSSISAIGSQSSGAGAGKVKASSGGDRPTESISFTFQKIEMSK